MLIGPSYVACLLSNHYELKSLGKKREGKKTVPSRTESNPWTRNILTKYSPLKGLWIFCLVTALNNIFKQTAISENTRILIITCYWVYFLPDWRSNSARFLKSRPPIQNNKLSRYLLHPDALGSFQLATGNTKDLLPSFTNAPNESTFCTLRILLISQTLEYPCSMKFLA